MTFRKITRNFVTIPKNLFGYADFDNIIVNNLGKDISRDISKLTISKFATVEIKI